MALVIEDGTGKTDADSYLSLADCDTYHTAKGDFATWDASEDALQEVALRQATAWIDTKFRLRWKGTRTNETQALTWPRSSVVDEDDFTLDTDAMPQRLFDCTAEMALKALSETLMPDQETPGAIEREKVKVGPLEEDITYSGASQQKLYAFAEAMLRGLIRPGSYVERG